jgi:hypothetical protein
LKATWSFIIDQTSETGFDPYMDYLASCVLLLKNSIRDKRLAHQTAETAMLCACYAKSNPGPDYSIVLDQLDSVMTCHNKRWAYGQYDFDFNNGHWSREIEGPSQERQPLEWHSTFLSYDIQHGLVAYVREKLGREPTILREKRGRPLLHYAMDRHFSSAMVETLFQYGAKPNRAFKSQSVWEMTLLALEQKLGKTHLGPGSPNLELLGICRQMLLNGADPNISIDGCKLPWSIITTAFISVEPVKTAELQELLKRCGAKKHAPRVVPRALMPWANG